MLPQTQPRFEETQGKSSGFKFKKNKLAVGHSSLRKLSGEAGHYGVRKIIRRKLSIQV
jgi:hypothetical protein